MTRAYTRRSSPFGRALRFTRTTLQLQRYDLAGAASKQYIGSLEQGVKSPTLNMVEKLAEAMQVHPLTLLVLTYAGTGLDDATEKLLSQVHSQITVLKDFNT
ncbi:helix-turn-helix domain-containing protein [Variovorax sp. HJSM1_2]|uniref:helix-turn-helix domain-containing protein n=1 Tax=Variovorax sp. HJSM1_2 TaxID=3366263 RepID=UPI003BCC2435